MANALGVFGLRGLMIAALFLFLTACEPQQQQEEPGRAPPAEQPPVVEERDRVPSAAPPTATAEAHRAEGRVEAIHTDQQTVTITHEPVPTLGWPEMTMDFYVEDLDLLMGIEEGQHIRFSFEEDPPGSYVVTEIEPLDRPRDDMQEPQQPQV
jgi:Cu/Ag efflux protein CusF